MRFLIIFNLFTLSFITLPSKKMLHLCLLNNLKYNCDEVETFFTLTFIFTLVSCEDKTPIVEYGIIPQPQKISYTNGSFKLSQKPSIAYPQSLDNEAGLLNQWLAKGYSVQPEIKADQTQGDIILSIDPSVQPDQKEAYILDVKRKTITIHANSATGILNGIQSLRQIMRYQDDKWIAQIGNIVDYPALGWRAFMLDEGRYFKGKEVVLNVLDQMSDLKLNVFHWHLTDDHGWRIEIKKYPKLTEIGAFRDSSEINNFSSNVFDGKPHDGFYTQADIKEVIDYATARHIMVVPK